ncbi:759_t:CDS:2 [Dentiscutata erythropus]|uniref:Ceramide glucosyltransferase n=1 Tax=Dentiscutata erythropus TaxID=1348616 RepID=A0A9N8WPC3_9GLOM|nr:759_t:CDS:2 [Dentiscutata erythropus]
MGKENFFRLVKQYQGQIPSDVQEYIMQTYTYGQESFKRHHVSVWESSTRVELTLMIIVITIWFFVIILSTLGYLAAPLKGVDCNLFENLSSSFRQDYPKFEIIFSVANDNDPAIAVVQKLMKKFPNVDAKLIIGDRDVGVNPKINNMIRAYESVKYDIIWILDSNVYVDFGCLGRSVDKLCQPGVGLVHHLPFAVRPETFGSELEMLFIDTIHAKMYLAINAIGPDSCVVGKSNLYRKSDIESIGGLAQFGKYMAEDNLLAKALWQKGFKHEMTSDLAYQPLGSMSITGYFLRRSRWTRIRKYTVTAATIVEPFIESILCGLCASYGFNLLWHIHPLNFLAFHLSLWFWIDLKLFQTLSQKKVDVETLRGFIMAWAIREITALPLYIYSVFGTTVDWREGTYQLKRDSTVIKISSSHQQNQAGGSISSSSSSDNQRSSFFQQFIVSILTSFILVMNIFIDILFSSQRNGNPVENTEENLKNSEKENTLNNMTRLRSMRETDRMSIT